MTIAKCPLLNQSASDLNFHDNSKRSPVVAKTFASFLFYAFCKDFFFVDDYIGLSATESVR